MRAYEQRRDESAPHSDGGGMTADECLMQLKGKDAKVEHEEDIRSEKEP